MKTTVVFDNDVAAGLTDLRRERIKVPVVRGGKWLLPVELVCTREILEWVEEGINPFQKEIQ